MDEDLIKPLHIPEVSVLMPAYNAGKYIDKAIRSILDQTYTDFELLIVNDCSTDTTAEIIASFSDKRIKYYENESNQGIAFTRNRLIQEARGKFVAMLDADDIAYKERLKLQLDFLTSNNDYALVCSWFEVIDEDGNNLSFFQENIKDEQLPVSLLFFNKIAQSSVMVNASFLPEDENLYDLNFPPAEDYELWVRLSRFGKMKLLPEILIKYRHYNENASHQKRADREKAVNNVYRKLLSDLNINFSNRELNIHKSLIDWELRFKENVTFSEIKAWLLKIKTTNLKTGIYPVSALDSIVSKILIITFNSEYKRFHPALLLILFERLPCKLENYRALVTITIKCLIGYRSKSFNK